MKRVLFLLEDYNLFYSKEALNVNRKGLKYNETLKSMLDVRFYQSDSMASAFEGLGYEVMVVVPECNPLQLKWAFENNIWLYIKWIAEKPKRSFKARFLKQHRTVYNSIHFQVLLQQIIDFRPDYVYFYSNVYITKKQLETIKSFGSKVILQWTCPIWEESLGFPYSSFDLVITASLQLVEYFVERRIRVKYLQQAFDIRILKDLVPMPEKKGDVVFIGGFSVGHEYRAEMLQFLLENGVNISIHGTGKETLTNFPLLQSFLKEPIFGNFLYNEYRKYKIAIHIPTTGIKDDGINWNKYSGAKRLFEITGAGTLLLTSWQENISDLFIDGEEVVTFKDKIDLISKIKFLLSRGDLITKIARAGQKRTVAHHSFNERAKLLEGYLNEL
jgi:hypothetical protein